MPKYWKAKQRNNIKRGIRIALEEHREHIHSGNTLQAAVELVRVSRMIANLNGVSWPE